MNNFDPLNKAIDESIRAQRARIAWQYAKVIALILVSIGILAVLLAWAYNIYKKPNPDLVRKIDEVDKRFEQSERLDDKEEKIVEKETPSTETAKKVEKKTETPKAESPKENLKEKK